MLFYMKLLAAPLLLSSIGFVIVSERPEGEDEDVHKVLQLEPGGHIIAKQLSARSNFSTSATSSAPRQMEAQNSTSSLAEISVKVEQSDEANLTKSKWKVASHGKTASCKQNPRGCKSLCTWIWCNSERSPHGCDLFRQDLRNAGYIPPSEYKFKWTHKHIVSLSTNHALDYWWTEMAEDMKHSELAVNFAELRKTEDDLAGEVEANEKYRDPTEKILKAMKLREAYDEAVEAFDQAARDGDAKQCHKPAVELEDAVEEVKKIDSMYKPMKVGLTWCKSLLNEMNLYMQLMHNISDVEEVLKSGMVDEKSISSMDGLRRIIKATETVFTKDAHTNGAMNLHRRVNKGKKLLAELKKKVKDEYHSKVVDCVRKGPSKAINELYPLIDKMKKCWVLREEISDARHKIAEMKSVLKKKYNALIKKEKAALTSLEDDRGKLDDLIKDLMNAAKEVDSTTKMTAIRNDLRKSYERAAAWGKLEEAMREAKPVLAEYKEYKQKKAKATKDDEEEGQEEVDEIISEKTKKAESLRDALDACKCAEKSGGKMPKQVQSQITKAKALGKELQMGASQPCSNMWAKVSEADVQGGTPRPAQPAAFTCMLFLVMLVKHALE